MVLLVVQALEKKLALMPDDNTQKELRGAINEKLDAKLKLASPLPPGAEGKNQ